jgi:hypothetical protein
VEGWGLGILRVKSEAMGEEVEATLVFDGSGFDIGPVRESERPLVFRDLFGLFFNLGK